MSLLVFLIAAATSFAVTALWLWLARRKQWLDHPNFRSSHQIPTPKSGGIGFVLGFFACVAFLFSTGELRQTDMLLFSGGLLLAVLGLLDDMKGLGIRSRLAVQVLAVISLLPFLQELPPLSFGPGFTIGGWWVVALIGLTLVWLVNLYNFMDGIDALAATQAIFFCLAVAVFAGIKGEGTLVLLLLCLAAAVSGFLYFNLPVARVFMGDLGSNFLGFTLGLLGLWAVKVGALDYWALLILLGTFVVDSTTTLLGRWVSGAVWYHPHRTHGYQNAALLLKSHSKVVVINLVINLLWLTPLAILVQRMPEWGVLLALAGLLPLAGVVMYLRKDKERMTE
jgi:Fuc2NAc and GlcNAc transferase